MLVWLCLSMCLVTVYSDRFCLVPLGIPVGKVCKLAAGASWYCKNAKDCPNTTKAIEAGDETAQMCGLTPDLEITVCCEPEGERGAKSREMCKKYAESVFRLPDEDTCGRGKPNPSRTRRVESQSREYPHMAMLGYENKTATEWLCGGTLISERFVLTTASCASGGQRAMPPKTVRLGELNIQSGTVDHESKSQPSEYEVIEVVKHPDYKPSQKYNDIALLKLNKDVSFTEFIRPICLQTDHQLPTTYGYVTGWGTTELTGEASRTLLTVNVTFFSQDECVAVYKDYKNVSIQDGILEVTMVCAGDKQGNRDTCQGDSGGPLQIPVDEPYCMYSQVGIASFGLPCGNGTPSVYTRISHYIPWIESVVWP